MTENQQIASVILQQIGGGAFRVMTGARSFLSIDKGIQFRLPSNFARNGINCVRIKLNADDLYDIEFGKISNKTSETLKGTGRGVKMPVYDTISEVEGVYGDQLARVFSEETGLDTSMGKIRIQKPKSGPSF